MSITPRNTKEDRKTIEMKRIYPKELPPLRKLVLASELDFTECEIITLRKAWAAIIPKAKKHGRKVLYTYLTANQSHINYFRTKGKLNLHLLHDHATSLVANHLGYMVDKGLEHPVYMQLALSQMFQSHKNAEVPKDIVMEVVRATIDHLLNVLKDKSSATLLSSFDKLMQLIETYNIQLYDVKPVVSGMKELSLVKIEEMIDDSEEDIDEYELDTKKTGGPRTLRFRAISEHFNYGGLITKKRNK